jgi:hypothetical protein
MWATNRILLSPAATRLRRDRPYPTPMGLGEPKSWPARPDQPLAFIQDKWEASSEVLMNDGRQVGHDDEEDRD